MITTILFDLDETILDFKKAEAIALSKTLETLGIEPKQSTISLYSEINDQHWKRLERGEITRRQVLLGRFEELFRRLEVDREPDQTQKIYEKLLGMGHYFLPNALEVLEVLSKDYRLYLVSNGTASVQAGRIESSGIAPLFQEIFISEEIGHNKPSVEYFEYCFKHIPDFVKEETIIIGDSLTSDIRGGNNAGIRTCWFNPSGQSRMDDVHADKNVHAGEDVHVDYEIHALTELPELMKRI